jgi:hypothetical protein
MTLEEIQKTNEEMRGLVARATRGDDSKWLLGAATRGIWELAEQVAKLNYNTHVAPKGSRIE